jgi:hypothetical protein
MKSRKSVELNERFNKHWLGYAAAAGAAGVGMMAAAQPAKADIIYTPANVNISPNGSGSIEVGGSVFTIAENHTASFFANTFLSINMLSVVRGAVVGTPGIRFGSLNYAARLGGSLVGGSRGAFDGGRMVWNYLVRATTHAGNSFSGGPWRGGGGGYLGLVICCGSNGGPEYGWAGVDVSAGIGGPISANIWGYAYDTVGGQPILAGQTSSFTPEPGTLGLLALGSLGLALWRRRKAIGTQQ